MIFYEHCSQIWGGSPATAAMAAGLESSENHDESSSQKCFDIDIECDDIDIECEDETDESNEIILDGDSQQTPTSRRVVKERRELLSAQVKGHKSERLKRKLPPESQLLSISQEELQIKKCLRGWTLWIKPTPALWKGLHQTLKSLQDPFQMDFLYYNA